MHINISEIETKGFLDISIEPTLDLFEEINNLKTQFVTYGGNKQVKGFDWAVEFAEVLADGGFDVVVANPPYGATVDDSTRDLYFDRKTEGAQSKDTYGLFIARGLQLLKSGGKLSYIVSDTWRTIKSHRPLRRRILAQTRIDHIIDLPSWIFDATVNTCIFTAAKEIADDTHHLITADLHNLKKEDWNNLALNLNAVADQSVHILQYLHQQAHANSRRQHPIQGGRPVRQVAINQEQHQHGQRHRSQFEEQQRDPRRAPAGHGLDPARGKPVQAKGPLIQRRHHHGAERQAAANKD